MFRPSPITPPTTSGPKLDRRNSDPCRSPAGVSPTTVSSLLSRVASFATQTPTQPVSIPVRPQSPTPSAYADDKIEWETLSRQGSDPSQCGYLSFPDFDRLSSTSGYVARD